MTVSKALKLSTGYMMPTAAIGCWLSPPEETIRTIKTAIRAGYRHIDTAQAYCNEVEVGQALKELIDAKEIKREDVFITTKLAMCALHPSNVRKATERSLKSLQTEYIDLYLIHAPIAVSDQGIDEDPWTSASLIPRYSDGSPKFAFVNPLDTWKEMEKLQEDGLVRSLGVSNFNKRTFQAFYEAARIKPANIQVECNLWFQQQELLDYCNQVGVTLAAYAPIGSPGRPANLIGPEGHLINDPQLDQFAKKYGRTKAQILLRFLLQIGVIILPKSNNPERIEENFQVYDFNIDNEDMETMKTMDRNLRMFIFSFAYTKGYPFFPWPEDMKN